MKRSAYSVWKSNNPKPGGTSWRALVGSIPTPGPYLDTLVNGTDAHPGGRDGQAVDGEGGSRKGRGFRGPHLPALRREELAAFPPWETRSAGQHSHRPRRPGSLSAQSEGGGADS